MRYAIIIDHGKFAYAAREEGVGASTVTVCGPARCLDDADDCRSLATRTSSSTCKCSMRHELNESVTVMAQDLFYFFFPFFFVFCRELSCICA